MYQNETSTRSLRWWLIVYAVFVTPLDFGTVGLTSSGPDVIRWGALFPVWFAPVLFLAPRWGRLTEAMRRPPWSWLFVWSVMGMVSVAWAVAPGQAILFGVSIAGLVVLAGWFVYTEGWFDFATAVVTGLTAFICAGLLFDLASGTLINGTLEGRTPGLSSSPTLLGRLAAIDMVMAAALISWTRTRARPMMMPWAALGAGSIALVFAEARTAMVAVIIGLAYGGLRRLSPLNRWLVAGAGLVLLVSVFLISAAFVDEVASLGDRGDPTTVSGRTDIWPVVLDMISRRPMLGYGWGAEETLFNQLARSGRITFAAFTTHSVALSPLISGGVIGFSLLATSLGSAFRLRHRADPWVLAPVVVILIGGLTEAIVHRPGISIFILSGCLAGIARVSNRTGNPSREPLGVKGPLRPPPTPKTSRTVPAPAPRPQHRAETGPG